MSSKGLDKKLINGPLKKNNETNESKLTEVKSTESKSKSKKISKMGLLDRIFF